MDQENSDYRFVHYRLHTTGIDSHGVSFHYVTKHTDCIHKSTGITINIDKFNERVVFTVTPYAGQLTHFRSHYGATYSVMVERIVLATPAARILFGK